MKICKECGKKLGILKGYQHPTMGKSNYLCSKCWDHVSTSVEKWKEFVILNSFNNTKHSNVNFYDISGSSNPNEIKSKTHEKNVDINKL